MASVAIFAVAMVEYEVKKDPGISIDRAETRMWVVVEIQVRCAPDASMRGSALHASCRRVRGSARAALTSSKPVRNKQEIVD